jgi:predicted GIY-YIG superfamily endonuclease
MSVLDRAEICYLLIFPDPAEKASEPLQKISGLKDAPYFQPVDIRVRTLGQIEVQAGGVQVSVLRQRYDDHIQILDCRFQLPDALGLKAIQQREIIEKNLLERLLPAEHLNSGMYEEYIMLLLVSAKPTPDKFIEKNSAGLARFMRSQREVFDPREIEDILISRVRYSNMELTLVDWDGAVIIAPNGDFQSDIELLKIGNYQLLRYRMLDQSIDIMLDKISKTFFEKKRRPRPTRGMIRQIAEHKLEVMLDFERAEQNLLLIGDWYTAKLYEAIQSEFYLKDWKENVKNKLDNLENIVGTIKDNFSLSLESVWARIEMLAWALMLIGYMYLTFVDLGLIKK